MRGERDVLAQLPQELAVTAAEAVGLLSRGHPVGATGMAQACELYWQLTGQAGQRQVRGAKLGLAYCKGGTVSGTDGASVTTVVMTA